MLASLGRHCGQQHYCPYWAKPSNSGFRYACCALDMDIMREVEINDNAHITHNTTSYVAFSLMQLTAVDSEPMLPVDGVGDSSL